jgi:hemoglobin
VANQGVDANAIRAAVDLFYERMLEDPTMQALFVSADTARLKMHQRAFVLQALGGPSLYSGRDMQTAHMGLGITDAQFALALKLLIASLREVGVAPDVVERAEADVEALRTLIVAAI